MPSSSSWSFCWCHSTHPHSHNTWLEDMRIPSILVMKSVHLVFSVAKCSLPPTFSSELLLYKVHIFFFSVRDENVQAFILILDTVSYPLLMHYST